MKKLYILALTLLATVASQAQTLKIFDSKGNEVANNQTVTITNFDEDESEEDEDAPGCYWYIFNAGLSLQGTTSGNIKIKGTITGNGVLSGLATTFISYSVCPTECTYFDTLEKGGVCENTFSYTANKLQDMKIHIGSKGNAPAIDDLVLKYTTNFEVYYSNNSSSKRTFTLVFDYDYKNAGVDNITVDSNSNAPVEYFNLNGVRVNGDNLTPGLYIRRQGNKTTKVLRTK
jgi:hypothetical protein